MGSDMSVRQAALLLVCDMDKHQRTMIEDKLPLGRMANGILGTNVQVEMLRPGKCPGTLLLPLACLLLLASPVSFLLLQPWVTGMTGVKGTLRCK
jgi:hypothetical protein